MEVLRVVCSVIVVAVVVTPLPHPWDPQLDEGVWDNLLEYGEKLFGDPSKSVGDAVAKWSPDSDLNPEELGEYAQGDILFPPTAARNGLKAASTHWEKGIVPYEIGPGFSGQDRAMIDEAIAEYHKRTCVKWVPRKGSEPDYVYFTNSNTGCWSSVGRIGGRQELNLQSPGCLTKKGTVEHEMMHALGFLHEQNRWERDKHVTVNYDNIQDGRLNNFEKAKKQETDSQGVAYDYHSIMHYSENAFSRNGQPTIVPKSKGVKLGQREKLSEKDVKKIRHMYKCH
ncbi:zinc metalloproteinase nas-14-like [Macrosteles quadrilineatus]|uniref:zinc metalloproteinase nas-14-like n=1 Tax=Macrosteles quadrilineatus TaxID=74068 RepID=UPI0023E0A3E5|nr:zinc metalloproteinase nas-14-like [Macrosteles quadrilineatus]